MAADERDRIVQRRAGTKHFSDSLGLQRGDVLLRDRAALVPLRVVRSTRYPLGLDTSASPSDLLAGLVRLQAAKPRFPARGSCRGGLERGRLRPGQAVLWVFPKGRTPVGY